METITEIRNLLHKATTYKDMETILEYYCTSTTFEGAEMQLDVLYGEGNNGLGERLEAMSPAMVEGHRLPDSYREDRNYNEDNGLLWLNDTIR